MQLWDELSMIYTTCIMCYGTFAWSRSMFFRIALGVGLVALAAFITIYYWYLQGDVQTQKPSSQPGSNMSSDPVFHQNAYAVLTAVVLLRAMYLMETHLRPSITKNERTIPVSDGMNLGKAPERACALKHGNELHVVLSKMWLMIAVGLSIFLSGFGIWQLDNTYCSDLRRVRRDLGLPWGILLEGHAWW